jgi:hypothetical protein
MWLYGDWVCAQAESRQAEGGQRLGLIWNSETAGHSGLLLVGRVGTLKSGRLNF